MLSYVISNLKFNLEGQVCSALITLEALKKSNATFEDIDGFTEFLRSIKNVEVSFLITEQIDGSYRS